MFRLIEIDLGYGLDKIITNAPAELDQHRLNNKIEVTQFELFRTQSVNTRILINILKSVRDLMNLCLNSN